MIAVSFSIHTKVLREIFYMEQIIRFTESDANNIICKNIKREACIKVHYVGFS